jgi:hypothetical protein
MVRIVRIELEAEVDEEVSDTYDENRPTSIG